jgi:WD40 repeat protein
LVQHLGRVHLSLNESMAYPYIYYSNSVDSGLLTIYNIQTLAVQRRISAHKSSILNIAGNAAGDLVATASTFGEVIRLWSSSTGQKLCTLDKLKGVKLTSLQISRHSNFISTCDNAGNFCMFRIPPDAFVNALKNAQKYITEDGQLTNSSSHDLAAFDKLESSDFGDTRQLIEEQSLPFVRDPTVKRDSMPSSYAQQSQLTSSAKDQLNQPQDKRSTYYESALNH